MCYGKRFAEQIIFTLGGLPYICLFHLQSTLTHHADSNVNERTDKQMKLKWNNRTEP